jgi:hypothetical protein
LTLHQQATEGVRKKLTASYATTAFADIAVAMVLKANFRILVSSFINSPALKYAETGTPAYLSATFRKVD